ncbi:hypothetical protein G7085_13690 [Tessaracoccus sp. HDW20]|uniref:hypothetical protein n=1 Tax=Tessaracoccus coleopterorum TaxID=2714950 RepID=UPI0018D4579D|nr:hypothetical protein [Tessaracoccus coleopterorum]NHB85318.1 hypothetical protein [Tessaracoccus coleopterorum]
MGADEGFVAVYNGLPGGFLGLSLSTLVERTDIAVADLPRFFQRQVEATIPLSSAGSAEGTTESFRELARRCVEVREERSHPKPTLAPSPLPTVQPTGPGLPIDPSVTVTPDPGLSATAGPFPSAITVTPTATEEADPEAC